MLGLLGLGDDEARVYELLVEGGPATTGALAMALGLDAFELDSLLRRMVESGYATVSGVGPDDEGLVTAAPPSVALGSALVERRHALGLAEIEIARLTESFHRSGAGGSVSDLVERLTGPEAVAARFSQIYATAQSEVLFLARAVPSLIPPEGNEAEASAVERGIRFRVVMERDSFDREGFYPAAANALREGMNVRVGTTVPCRLLVADRTTAMVSLRDADPIEALVVHRSGLLDVVLELFEMVWRAATPLTLGVEGTAALSPDEAMDRTIMGLLLIGLTDESIATRLQISTRTVQRRVRSLMTQLGAQTRVELGYHAARLGWGPFAEPVSRRGPTARA